MGESARIKSVAALRDMKVALAEFVDQVNIALAGVDADIGRTAQWLQHDRPAYYKSAIRRATDEVTRAKGEISRKQYMRAPGPVSVVEEKKKLDALKRRLEELERRADAVRKWGPQYEREAMLYKSSVRPLAELVQATLPRAIERLERMASAVEEYARIQPGDAAITAMSVEWEAEPTQALEATRVASTAEKYAGLRAHVPPPEARRGSPGPIGPAWSAGGIDDATRSGLAGLSQADSAPEAGATVAMAWRAWSSEAVVLIRVTPLSREDGLIDSGWCLVPLERPEEPGGYGVCRVQDLLEKAPSLRELLSLRVGSLAVVAGGQVRSVLDESDQERWVRESA